MLDHRLAQMLLKLEKEGCMLPLRELAEAVSVSPKTARTLLEQGEAEGVSYGYALALGRHGNVSLTVTDPNLFSTILAAQPPREGLDSAASARLNDLLARLLWAKDYRRIEDLADEMFVSRATLDRLMPELKELAAQYDLRLQARPWFGIRLEGSELNKRRCYAHCAQRSQEQDRQMAQAVQQILLETVHKHQLTLSDNNFYNLVQHCIIAIRRIRAGDRLDALPVALSPDASGTERAAAHEIVERFEQQFAIDFPPAEETYIVMHLMGKRVLEEPAAIRPEVFAGVDAILNEIYEEKGVDLRGDTELRTALALHLQPLLYRLSFGLRQQNPVLQEIKHDMTEGYEIALCAMEVIRRRYGLVMDEDEAGYLAMHFALSLERQSEGRQNKRILIVCASGRGTSRLLRHRLAERYHFDAESLVPVSAYQLPEEDFRDVLCILSTVPLLKQYPVPTFTVELAVGAQNQQLDHFLEHASRQAPPPDAAPTADCPALLLTHCDGKSREEILTFLCAEAAKRWPLPEDFTRQVLEREHLSSTEVGGGVALPHPYAYHSQQTVLCILALEKPVRWKYQNVQLVLLLALPEQETPESARLGQAVSELASDEKKIKQLLKTPTMEAVQELLF